MWYSDEETRALAYQRHAELVRRSEIELRFGAQAAAEAMAYRASLACRFLDSLGAALIRGGQGLRERFGTTAAEVRLSPVEGQARH